MGQIERLRPRNTREVTFGQPFHLLDGVWETEPSILTAPPIAIRDVIETPLTIKVNLFRVLLWNGYTPFDPEIGVRTSADEVEFGVGGTVAENQWGIRSTYVMEAPWRLSISSSNDCPDEKRFRHRKKSLDRLHLVLAFPGAEFEATAKTHYHVVRTGQKQVVNLENFYHRSIGPVGTYPHDRGYNIYLPDDFKRLSEIQAMFVNHSPLPNIKPVHTYFH